MTHEKFIHYLGAELVAFICSLTATQLSKMKAELCDDIRDFRLLGTQHHAKGMIELNIINDRLGQ